MANNLFSKAEINALKESIVGDVNSYAEQIAQNSKDISSLKGDKLDKPENAPSAAGKILRVLAVNEDGTFTCEWADAPSGGGAVDDVKINGISIVGENGVANVPVASLNTLGVISLWGARKGHSMLQNMYLVHETPSESNIKNRRNAEYGQMAVTLSSLDNAIRLGFADGIGAAWTDTERLAALLRMGCTVDDNGFVRWTAQEVTK